MEKKPIQSGDFDPAVYDLFDRYVHGQISRRQFLERASRYAVGGLTASAILAYLSPRYAEAAQIDPQDSRLRSEYVTYDSPKGAGPMRGYLLRTMKTGASIHTSRMLPAGQVWLGFSPFRRTR